MVKYSRERLREMAREVISDILDGGDRGFELVMRMSIESDRNPQDVVDDIQALAA